MKCFGNCNFFSIVFQTILNTLNFCVGLITLHIFFICLMLLKLVFFPWRCFVFVALKLTSKKNISFMKGKDALYFVETNATRKYHTLVIVMDSSADLNFMRTLLQKQLMAPKDNSYTRERMLFAPYYSFGYWFWEDKSKEFDISLHVKRMDGINDNHVVTESQMLNRLSDIIYEPLSKEKPMWEYLYVPKFKYDKDVQVDNQEPQHLCAYVVRCQHFYGDALSLLKGFIFKSFKTPTLSDIKQPQLSILHKFHLISKGITKTGNMVLRPSSPEKTPIFGPELSGDKLLCASKIIDFDLIRKIRKKYEMSVYSSLIATVIEALKKYFTEKKLDMPVSMTVIINTIRKIPKPENFALSNNAVRWKIPIIFTEKPEEERFQKITKDVRHSLDFMAYLGKFVLPITHWLLTGCPFLIIMLLGGMRVPVSLFLVNLPASMTDTILDGKNVYGLLAFSPHHGKLGLSTCFISYEGNIRLGLNVDKALIGKKEDAELIVKYWEESVRELSSY